MLPDRGWGEILQEAERRSFWFFYVFVLRRKNKVIFVGLNTNIVKVIRSWEKRWYWKRLIVFDI